MRLGSDVLPECSDYELLYMIRQKSEEALTLLIERYRNLISSSSLQLIREQNGAFVKKEDLVQEGLVGLHEAVDSYCEEKMSSFRTFANLCVKRKIKNYIRLQFSYNARINAQAVSLDSLVSEASGIYLIDVIADRNAEDPAEQFRKEERRRDFDQLLSSLTEEELKICRLWSEGHSYREIAELLQLDVKAVDNSLQRMKRVLRKAKCPE